MRVSTGAMILVAALWSSAAPAQIVDMGKFPDSDGQWRRVPDGGPPRYDPSKPNGLGQQAPPTPEAQANLEASLKDHEAGGQGLDQTYKCARPEMTHANADSQCTGMFAAAGADLRTRSLQCLVREYPFDSHRRLRNIG